jgi:hypothetical protein
MRSTKKLPEEISMHASLRWVTAAAAAAASLSAYAFPIAPLGTEGLSVIAAGGDIVATYEGNSASYSNDLYLVRPGGDLFVFNNHASAVGSSVDLGTFAAGTELIFRLHVNNTGYDYFTGPASRNPDGKAHARVQTDYTPGTTLVSFEDLFGTPEYPGGYNDLSFSFTHTVAGVPEPETYALMLGGLAALGAWVRRRKTAA